MSHMQKVDGSTPALGAVERRLSGTLPATFHARHVAFGSVVRANDFPLIHGGYLVNYTPGVGSSTKGCNPPCVAPQVCGAERCVAPPQVAGTTRAPSADTTTGKLIKS
ncbi:unnamed protein product [Toxocara canis]|uniref:Serine acetyltransferase n=1 Tax=Toxocara canis TaxID=6265 RepID=A0A183TYQ5_TOXCA|nr:unnamed protein product [Toxocara canis]